MLLLDEPTAGLDPDTEARTLTRLCAVADAGRTVLMATGQPAGLDAAEHVVRLPAPLIARRHESPPWYRADRTVILLTQRAADGHHTDQTLTMCDGRLLPVHPGVSVAAARPPRPTLPV